MSTAKISTYVKYTMMFWSNSNGPMIGMLPSNGILSTASVPTLL